MRQTRLMRGVDKLPVRRPAISLEDARVVGAQRPRRLRKAAAVLNRIDRGVDRRKGPEPVGMATDFPPGFIGRDDGTAADRGAEGRVGRLRLPRGACDGLHQAAARDGQPEAITEQLHDPAKGEPALFVENDRERDGVRPELHRRRAKRIGRLQGMAALHATMTLPAAPHRDAKLVDDRPLHRQVFVVLQDDAAPDHRATAIGTMRGQRYVVSDIDARRAKPMGVAPVRGAGFPARALRMRLRQAARKRRRLPARTAARHLELFFQSLVFASQPVAFDLGPFQIVLEPFDPLRLVFDDLLRVTRRRILGRPRHAIVMPESRAQYKEKPLCLRVSVARDRCEARASVVLTR